MQTVREVVEANTTTADIYEIKNVKPTGIFFYEVDRLLENYGSRLVEEIMIIKGISNHDAVLRMYLKVPN